MKYAWPIVAVFAGRFLATALAFSPLDGDLPWQRRLGDHILRYHSIPRALGLETFTAPSHAWTPQEWLFSLGAALARPAAGWWAFTSASAAAATLALVLSALHAQRRGASPRAVALCTALAGVALFESFGVRAQVLAWPLLAALLVLLDADGAAAYGAIGIAALWSNLHASALLAPLAVAASTLGTWLDGGRRSTEAARRAFLLTVGCALGVCANPFGIGLVRYALGLVTSDMPRYIDEWQPTSLADPSFAFGALPVLLIALTLAGAPHARRWRDCCLLVPFTYLLLSAARDIAIFALVAAPLAAAALTRNLRWFAPQPQRNDRHARIFEGRVLPGVSAVLAGVVFFGLAQRRDLVQQHLEARAVAALAARPGDHRLLCSDFAWCGAALELPRVRVFIDARADPYPPAVWADYVEVAGLHARWRRVLAARRVDAVLVLADAPLDRALLATHDWRLIYRDANVHLWSRPRVAAAEAPVRAVI